MLLNNCVRQEGKVVVVVRRETFPASSWMSPIFHAFKNKENTKKYEIFYRMGVWFLLVTQEKTAVMSFTSDKMLAEHSIVRGRSVCCYCAESDGSIVCRCCHADKKLLQNRWMCYFRLPYFPFLWTSVECTHDCFHLCARIASCVALLLHAGQGIVILYCLFAKSKYDSIAY